MLTRLPPRCDACSHFHEEGRCHVKLATFEIGGAITNRVRKRGVNRSRRDPLEDDSPVVTIMVSMTEEDRDALDRLCKECNLQRSTLVRRAIKAYRDERLQKTKSSQTDE
jgi:hypothetical protein